MPLQPPPPGAHDTCEELIVAAKSWAAAEGYAVTICRSNSKKGIVYLGCNCGGSYRNTHKLTTKTRQCETGSCRKDFPFSVIGRNREELGSFQPG